MRATSNLNNQKTVENSPQKQQQANSIPKYQPGVSTNHLAQQHQTNFVVPHNQMQASGIDVQPPSNVQKANRRFMLP